MKAHEIPTLSTGRLTLRPFTPDHAAPLHGIMQDPAVLQYFPSTKTPSLELVNKLIAGQIKHWEEHQLGWWAVEPKTDASFMGWCGLQYLPETDEIEVGYLLGRDFWGHGYATEAGRASLQFAFDTLNLEAIVGIVHPENIASQRVLEKLGLKWIEEKEYFGMHCYRYLITQSTYLEFSAAWPPHQ